MSYQAKEDNGLPIKFNSDQVLELSERIIDLVTRKANFSDRLIVLIAGVPGSGKTTIANNVCKVLNSQHLKTEVLSQDGYHYYREELRKFDNPEEAIERRGAPFTFNASAFLNLISKLNDPTYKNDNIFAPSFDHKLKDPVEEDVQISSDTKVILIEGNYVLLKDPIWSEIGRIADDTWYVEASTEEVRLDRIVKRHLAAGIASTVEDARARAMGSDQLNADYIVENSQTPKVIIKN